MATSTSKSGNWRKSSPRGHLWQGVFTTYIVELYSRQSF